MKELLYVGHVLISVALVALVLIQHGKGADAGAAFGTGASSTVFGSRGSASFLTRATAILATLFFLSNLALAYLSTQIAGEAKSVVEGSVLEKLPAASADLPTVDVKVDGSADLPPAVDVRTETSGGAESQAPQVAPPASLEIKTEAVEAAPLPATGETGRSAPAAPPATGAGQQGEPAPPAKTE